MKIKDIPGLINRLIIYGIALAICITTTVTSKIFNPLILFLVVPGVTYLGLYLGMTYYIKKVDEKKEKLKGDVIGIVVAVFVTVAVIAAVIISIVLDYYDLNIPGLLIVLASNVALFVVSFAISSNSDYIEHFLYKYNINNRYVFELPPEERDDLGESEMHELLREKAEELEKKNQEEMEAREKALKNTPAAKERRALDNKIVKYCRYPRTKDEIMKLVDLDNEGYVTVTYINPLVEEGRLHLTNPDDPYNVNQRYYSE